MLLGNPADLEHILHKSRIGHSLRIRSQTLWFVRTDGRPLIGFSRLRAVSPNRKVETRAGLRWVLGLWWIIIASGCALPFLAAGAVQHAQCGASYADSRYETDRLTNYTVPRSLQKSPMGVPIGPGVDGPRVDRAFQKVAACLGRKFYPCAVHAVMLAPDWRAETDELGDKRQVFPCRHPKGSQLCTGAVQWPATIVITPDHYALTWEAERLLLMDDPDKDGGKRCWQQAELLE